MNLFKRTLNHLKHMKNLRHLNLFWKPWILQRTPQPVERFWWTAMFSLGAEMKSTSVPIKLQKGEPSMPKLVQLRKPMFCGNAEQIVYPTQHTNHRVSIVLGFRSTLLACYYIQTIVHYLHKSQLALPKKKNRAECHQQLMTPNTKILYELSR